MTVIVLQEIAPHEKDEENVEGTPIQIRAQGLEVGADEGVEENLEAALAHPPTVAEEGGVKETGRKRRNVKFQDGFPLQLIASQLNVLVIEIYQRKLPILTLLIVK